jgi:hypothetical protein
MTSLFAPPQQLPTTFDEPTEEEEYDLIKFSPLQMEHFEPIKTETAQQKWRTDCHRTKAEPETITEENYDEETDDGYVNTTPAP